MKIKMDGKTYNLGVVAGSLAENFEIREGSNSGQLLDGDTVRDIVGTYYHHTLTVQPDPEHYEDYVAFFKDISAPVAFHTITMPHIDGEVTYEVMVSSGGHTHGNRVGGKTRFSGLHINLKARRPQIIA